MEEYNSCLQKEEDKLKLEGYDEYDSRQVQVDLEDRATVQSILNIINSYHDLVQKKHLFRPGRMSQDDIKDFVKDNFDSFYVD